ncbi:MAG: hypothetical protein AAGF12_09820 [Myxococcota bacterium]
MSKRTWIHGLLATVYLGSSACGDSTGDEGSPDAAGVDASADGVSDAPVAADATPDGDADVGWMPTAEPCPEAGGFGNCTLIEWADRPYSAYRPTNLDLSTPSAVVIVLHGGSGNSNAGISTSCPGGNLDDPACWHQVAEVENFLVLFPNGTSSAAMPNQRAWNSGGGANGYQCVGGAPCRAGVDDVGYVGAVLDDVSTWANVDPGAVFATGLSNGAALSHRLACEASDRIAAIAPVGGANQFAAVEACEPSQTTAILHIHGTADPCWEYEESNRSCLGAIVAAKVGAVDTMADWAVRHRCTGGPDEVEEPDPDGDGIRTVAMTWTGCDAPVVLLRNEGAGHTYPNGRQYAPEANIGRTIRDWGSERIWQFFRDNRRP